MAIQNINLGTAPNGVGGDTLRSTATKINENFSNATHAASRLLGTGAEQVPLSKNIASLLGTAATKDVGQNSGNIMGVGAFGFGGEGKRAYANFATQATSEDLRKAQMVGFTDTGSMGYPSGFNWSAGNRNYSIVGSFLGSVAPYLSTISNAATDPNTPERIESWKIGQFLVLGYNVVKDANGFYKGASPVVDLYNDRVELNQDAEKQPITFEKVTVGDYLVKGSLGFSLDGWYIETPKDANGNVLVAVVYEQLANNDLSIKTYAKKFDDETGDIVANLLKPRDIPVGRFISLRLHEEAVEPVEDLEPTEAPTTLEEPVEQPKEPIAPSSEV